MRIARFAGPDGKVACGVLRGQDVCLAGGDILGKGHTPAIPGTGRRFGCNMISAITSRGHLAFMAFNGRFTADVMIEFLRRLVKQRDRKVFLQSYCEHESVC